MSGLGGVTNEKTAEPLADWEKLFILDIKHRLRHGYEIGNTDFIPVVDTRQALYDLKILLEIHQKLLERG